jgi:hypothetical protein
MSTPHHRRLSDYPAQTIRDWLAAAEQSLGRDSGTARALRGELARRRQSANLSLTEPDDDQEEDADDE